MADVHAFKAGDWEVETFGCDGASAFPMVLRHKGRDILVGIHHREVKDLIFILDRMRATMRAKLVGNKKHEMD